MTDIIRSANGRYQYELRHRWADGALCGWILLNPSLTGRGDDKGLGTTGERCADYAFRWGYAGIVIRNRYAFRATDPRDLLKVKDPYGPDNERYLAAAIQDAITVAAWGGSRAAAQAPPLPCTRALMCIGVNRDGSPRHPLHAAADAELRPWP